MYTFTTVIWCLCTYVYDVTCSAFTKNIRKTTIMFFGTELQSNSKLYNFEEVRNIKLLKGDA